MIRNLLVLGGLFGAITAYTLYADFASSPQHQQETGKTENTIVSTAPDFSFTDFVSGEKHALYDFKNKTVVLNFWATWCTPCAVEFPQMLSLAKSLEKDDVVFLFLSVDENEEDIARFLSKDRNKIHSENVIVARDADKSVSQDLFQTTKFPETYLIGPNMDIHEKVVGAVDNWGSKEMREKVKNIRR